MSQLYTYEEERTLIVEARERTSLLELEIILQRRVRGIVSKIDRLSKRYPDVLDSDTVSYYWSQYYYNHRNGKKMDGRTHETRRKRRYSKFMRQGKNYTSEEINRLHDGFNQGIPLSELEVILDRSDKGILWKLKRLVQQDPERWNMEILIEYQRQCEILNNDDKKRRKRRLYKRNSERHHGLIRRGESYTPSEIDRMYLEFERETPLEELVEIFGRSSYAILSTLRVLSNKDASKWDKKRVAAYRRQYYKRLREYEPKKGVKTRRNKTTYTPEELEILHKEFDKETSFPELEEIFGRSIYGMLAKFEKLVQQDPERWNKEIYLRYRKQYNAIVRHTAEINQSENTDQNTPHTTKKSDRSEVCFFVPEYGTQGEDQDKNESPQYEREESVIQSIQDSPGLGYEIAGTSIIGNSLFIQFGEDTLTPKYVELDFREHVLRILERVGALDLYEKLKFDYEKGDIDEFGTLLIFFDNHSMPKSDRRELSLLYHFLEEYASHLEERLELP